MADEPQFITRARTRLVRWSWEYQHADGSISAGWTATRRGARREIDKASRREWDVTGPHGPLTVGWSGAERTDGDA